LSIYQSAITLLILSFNAPISCSIFAWFATSKIPPLLNSRLIVIPAKINKTTIVTTNAISVIPFGLESRLSLSLSLSYYFNTFKIFHLFSLSFFIFHYYCTYLFIFRQVFFSFLFYKWYNKKRKDKTFLNLFSFGYFKQHDL